MLRAVHPVDRSNVPNSVIPDPVPDTPRRRRARAAGGFTLVELIWVTIICILIAIVLMPALTPRRRGHPQLKDSTQVRGIVQANIVFAANNAGRYPLPSVLDTADQTVPERGVEKDTTANILSILIWNGNLSPDILINPREVNWAEVQQDTNYQFKDPIAAVSSTNALWDPGFRGTPLDPIRARGRTTTAIGNQSYAHIIPEGRRLSKWSDTYSSTEAVFGDRGPTYAAMDFAPAPATGKWALIDAPQGTPSNTLLIHGGKNTWEGNIGYNDGHVTFETKPNPDAVTYARAVKAGKPVATMDNLFVNEADEHDGDVAPGALWRGVNAYLRPIAERPERRAMTLWRD